MKQPTRIPDQLIEAQVGPRNMARGHGYVAQDALFAGRRAGQTLSAACHGSRAEPYRVEVVFGEGGVERADCTCPVGASGQCKHVAALLLAYRDDPQAFVEMEDADESLARRSKEELIALIKHMVRRAPALAFLVHTPLHSADARDDRVASAERYYRQATSVFENVGLSWETGEVVARDLETLEEIGDGFLEAGAPAHASAVFQGVSAAVIEHYEQVHDEEGDIASVVARCVAGLGACLASEGLPAERRRTVLQVLFDIVRADMDLGGMGLGNGVPAAILAHTTAEERHMVARWVREAMPGDEAMDWTASYKRVAYGGLLLDLEADVLDDEAYIDLCRRTGRTVDLVARLLAGGQEEAALAEARAAEDSHLPMIANLLVQQQNGLARDDLAEALMEERARTSASARILDWLVQHYQARGNPAAALDAVVRRFRRWPGLPGYEEARALARALGRWDEVRPTLQSVIEEGQHVALRIRVHLVEGELDAALAALFSTEASRKSLYHWEVAMEVAAAAERQRPEAALDLYRRYAEELIARRGRPSYQLACHYLRKVRALHTRLGAEEAWQGYIDTLRQQNRRLPALQDELAAAQL